MDETINLRHVIDNCALQKIRVVPPCFVWRIFGCAASSALDDGLCIQVFRDWLNYNQLLKLSWEKRVLGL